MISYSNLYYICSNLSMNKLEGSVPESLRRKVNESLVLRLAHHPSIYYFIFYVAHPSCETASICIFKGM